MALYCWNTIAWSQNKYDVVDTLTVIHVNRKNAYIIRLSTFIIKCGWIKKGCVLQLNKLVLEGYVDWDYESKYIFRKNTQRKRRFRIQ